MRKNKRQGRRQRARARRPNPGRSGDRKTTPCGKVWCADFVSEMVDSRVKPNWPPSEKMEPPRVQNSKNDPPLFAECAGWVFIWTAAAIAFVLVMLYARG